jgi:hypothetical protein
MIAFKCCFRRLRSLNFPTQFKARPPNPFSAFETLQEFLQSAPFERLSILSPRLMSLFPSDKSDSAQRTHFISPDLFSFHDEGAFPLPRFFRVSWNDVQMMHTSLDGIE